MLMVTSVTYYCNEAILRRATVKRRQLTDISPSDTSTDEQS